MSAIKKIKIDLLQKSVPPVIDAVQGESLLRILEVHLYSGSVPFDGDFLFASCAYKKPDGTTGWYDTLPNEQPGVSLLQNVVTVVLAPEMLTVPGDVCAVIRIDSEETGSRIITFPFIISVSPDPAIDSPKSENYYSVQTWDDVNSSIEELYRLVGSGGGGGGGTSGADGTTFFPSVSADGVISWTNDGGKENPAPVDLRAAVIASLPVYNGEVEPV